MKSDSVAPLISQTQKKYEGIRFRDAEEQILELGSTNVLQTQRKKGVTLTVESAFPETKMLFFNSMPEVSD